MWNTLPNDVVSVSSVNDFKDKLWYKLNLYYNYKANISNHTSNYNKNSTGTSGSLVLFDSVCKVDYSARKQRSRACFQNSVFDDNMGPQHNS